MYNHIFTLSIFKHFAMNFIFRPYAEGGKHTIFIVNTVPLVIQQSDYIKRLTGLSCGTLSSEEGVDFWHDEEWNEHLNNHEVMKVNYNLEILLQILFL